MVLFPGVGVGHLAPMLELAKAFLRHGGGAVDVAVAVAEPPVMANGFAATVARAEAANASVAFHFLPPPPPAPGGGSGEPEPEQDVLARMLRFLRATNAPLRDLLRSLLPPVGALVLDMFCGDALDVAAELGVPAYFFFPSGAAGLAVFLALPARRASMSTSFAGLGASAVLSFPGAPPFKVSEMAEGLSDDGEVCRAILRVASRMPDARGILVNSFESLEPRAVRALRDGLCVPGRATPRRRSTASGRWSRPAAATARSTSASGGWTRSRTAASCSCASGAWARSPRASSPRSPQAWRNPGIGSSGSCGALRLPAPPANHSTATTTSTRSCRPGSWSAPGTGGSPSGPGRRRWTCCATARPARS